MINFPSFLLGLFVGIPIMIEFMVYFVYAMDRRDKNAAKTEQ